MENKTGDFSRNWLSIMLQLKSLFEGSGGEDVLQVLDRLGELQPSERPSVITAISRAVERFRITESKPRTREDAELQKFEEDLFNDLLKAFSGKSVEGAQVERNLAVNSDENADPIPTGTDSTITIRRSKKRESHLSLVIDRSPVEEKSGTPIDFAKAKRTRSNKDKNRFLH
jgi:hypothetical protein